MIIEMRFLNDDHECVAQIMGPGESANEIDAFAAAFKVAAHLALRVEEPYYVPDNDDIQITKTGEDIRPQVHLGEPCQIEDDLHWDEHHEARMDVIGQNGGDGLHYNDPKYQQEIQQYRNSKHTDDCLADDMSAHVIGEIKLAGSYRTPGYMGPRPMAHFRPDLTSEEIAMLEGRAEMHLRETRSHEWMEGDDAEVVGT